MTVFYFQALKAEPILDFLKSIKANIDWRQKIQEGKIRVHRSFVGIRYQLKEKDLVSYDPFYQIREPSVNFAYQILYEDSYLAVIDKPCPLPVHPSGSFFRHTLTEILKSQGRYWFTINRIDSETSGLLILVKNSKDVAKVSEAFKKAEKTYLVLVDGIPPKKFTVEFKLGNRPGLVHKKRGRNEEQGKWSQTFFFNIASYKERSLLFAIPHTGRTHQIRAHLYESGYPVVGDKIYGKDECYFIEFLEKGMTEELLKKLELPRQFLHAYRIKWTHPFSGEKLHLKAKLPSDLRDFLLKHNFKLNFDVFDCDYRN